MLWKSKTSRLKTTLRLFNSNIKAVLTCGTETWRVSKQIIGRATCISQQMPALYPRNQMASVVIRNQDLWEITNQEKMTNQIRRRNWRRIGYVCPENFGAVWQGKRYSKTHKAWGNGAASNWPENDQWTKNYKIALNGVFSWMPYAPHRISGVKKMGKRNGDWGKMVNVKKATSSAGRNWWKKAGEQFAGKARRPVA